MGNLAKVLQGFAWVPAAAGQHVAYRRASAVTPKPEIKMCINNKTPNGKSARTPDGLDGVGYIKTV